MWYIFYFISYIGCILNMEEGSKGHVMVIIVEIEHVYFLGKKNPYTCLIKHEFE